MFENQLSVNENNNQKLIEADFLRLLTVSDSYQNLVTPESDENLMIFERLLLSLNEQDSVSKILDGDILVNPKKNQANNQNPTPGFIHIESGQAYYQKAKVAEIINSDDSLFKPMIEFLNLPQSSNNIGICSSGNTLAVIDNENRQTIKMRSSELFLPGYWYEVRGRFDNQNHNVDTRSILVYKPTVLIPPEPIILFGSIAPEISKKIRNLIVVNITKFLKNTGYQLDSSFKLTRALGTNFYIDDRNWRDIVFSQDIDGVSLLKTKILEGNDLIGQLTDKTMKYFLGETQYKNITYQS